MIFTYCGWFTLSSVTDISLPVVKSGDDLAYQLKYDPTNGPPLLGWYCYGESFAPLETFVTLDADTPYFIAVYWDGDTMGLSVDGAEWTTASTCETLYDDPNAVLRVAGDPSDAGPVSCTKFKAYPRVLTNAEIASLHQEGA